MNFHAEQLKIIKFIMNNVTEFGTMDFLKLTIK